MEQEQIKIFLKFGGIPPRDIVNGAVRIDPLEQFFEIVPCPDVVMVFCRCALSFGIIDGNSELNLHPMIRQDGRAV